MNLAPAFSRDSDLEEERQGVQIDHFKGGCNNDVSEHPDGIAAEVSEWKAVRGGGGGGEGDKDTCSPVGQAGVLPSPHVPIPANAASCGCRLPRISHPSCTLFSHDRLSSLYLTTCALSFERHHQSSQLGQFP